MFYTYIMASCRNGTLYTGSTDDLGRRAFEHREGLIPGFTQKYGVKLLVWFEAHETRAGAFRQERRIKEWRRAWKLKLIEDKNPRWLDLYERLNDFPFVDANGGLRNWTSTDLQRSPHNPLIPANAGTQNPDANRDQRTGSPGLRPSPET